MASSASTSASAAHRRAVQLTYINKSGLSDKKAMFAWLLCLGELLDADTFIAGGMGSTNAYLADKHSAARAKQWSTYFDASAHAGHPFKSARDRGCVNVDTPERLAVYVRAGLWQYWQREGQQQGQPAPPGEPEVAPAWNCLNISLDPWRLKRSNHTELSMDYLGFGEGLARLYISTRRQLPPRLLPSRYILDLADVVLRRHNASMHGVVHIRRADRGGPNCTLPAHVVEQGTGDGGAYLNSLQKELTGLGVPVVYEHDLFPPDLVPADNYVTYYVGVLLMHLAEVRGACVDTRFCFLGSNCLNA